MRNLLNKLFLTVSTSIKYILITGFVLCFGLLLTGCGEQVEVSTASSDVVIHDGNVTSETVKNLNKGQPLPVFTYSLERASLINRLNLWNQPNKISYVVLFSYGKVVTSFVVKGKVSSVNSLLTNPQQLVNPPNINGTYAMPSADLDGSYGDNPPGSIFFFTAGADNRYVEWHGDYLWTDKPITVLTPPEVTISADKKN